LNSPEIKKSTQKKIEETAQASGYQRNNFATPLLEKNTKTIGVIVPKLFSHFISSALAGIEKVATAAGYSTIIAQSDENLDREVTNAFNLFHSGIDGLIVSLACTDINLSHFEPFEEKGIPMVFVDRVSKNSRGLKIVIDNHRCGYEATQHLIEQGCKKIVIVTANLDKSVYEERRRGYADALAANDIAYDPVNVLTTVFNEAGGQEIATQLLAMDPMPDGVFFTNDFAAIVCMRTLKENGIRIPQDIAIVGFNNDPLSTVIYPPLTTIDYPGIKLGEIAAENLINCLNGTAVVDTALDTIVLPSPLIIRQSSLKSEA
jgi:LacI family transcriptional regulator